MAGQRIRALVRWGDAMAGLVFAIAAVIVFSVAAGGRVGSTVGSVFAVGLGLFGVAVAAWMLRQSVLLLVGRRAFRVGRTIRADEVEAVQLTESPSVSTVGLVMGERSVPVLSLRPHSWESWNDIARRLERWVVTIERWAGLERTDRQVRGRPQA